MLLVAFTLLSLAVLLGLCLLAGRLHRASIVHGAAGAAGLLCLVLAWRQSALSGAFARDAIVLLAAGLCGGLQIAVLKRAGRASPGLLIFLHASAGGLAYLLVAGFAFGR
jgi:drug/metabolite transporter (DMT)-like permease